MVTTSTTENEIVAANEATKAIIWLTRPFSVETYIRQVDNTLSSKISILS